MALLGYCRVSKTDGSQVTDLQHDALIAAGVEPSAIYEDQASGKRDDRPGLENCVKALRPGDVLVCWKLDRIGRNLKHLVEVVDELSRRQIGFESAERRADRHDERSGKAGVRHLCGPGGIRARADRRAYRGRSDCRARPWTRRRPATQADQGEIEARAIRDGRPRDGCGPARQGSGRNAADDLPARRTEGGAADRRRKAFTK